MKICPTCGSEVPNGTNSFDLVAKVEEKARRKIPPTLAMVKAYVAENGYRVDAQNFLDHYTANGWKVGRNAMKDWQAAVRTWAAKSREPESGRLAI